MLVSSGDEINSNDFVVFCELISRFEFEFCRCVKYFLKDSNFWCVHVNVPWPVCAHAIPFRMLWLPRFMMTYMYFSVCIHNFHKHFHVQVHVRVRVRVLVRVFVFVLACCCCCRCGLLWLMCVVVVVVEEGKEGGDKPNHVTTDSLRSVP